MPSWGFGSNGELHADGTQNLYEGGLRIFGFLKCRLFVNQNFVAVYFAEWRGMTRERNNVEQGGGCASPPALDFYPFPVVQSDASCMSVWKIQIDKTICREVLRKMKTLCMLNFLSTELPQNIRQVVGAAVP